MRPAVVKVLEQYVDPVVTRAKYDEEINRFFQQYHEWQKKGVFLINDQFPECEFLFLVPRLFPISPVFGVRINFTNFDAEPPSVRFINPYTGTSLKREQIPLQFKQKASAEYIDQKKPVDPSEGMDICVSVADKHPFICHPGFKEYHDHPYHTGDSWLIRRAAGEGRLYRILQVLHDHGTSLIESVGVKRIGNQEAQIHFVQRKP